MQKKSIMQKFKNIFIAIHQHKSSVHQYNFSSVRMQSSGYLLSPIPVFPYGLELRLAKWNELFRESGALLSVSIEMAHKTTQRQHSLGCFFPHPTNQEIESVSAMLTEKLPCLIDWGVGARYYWWAIIKNYGWQAVVKCACEEQRGTGI